MVLTDKKPSKKLLSKRLRLAFIGALLSYSMLLSGCGLSMPTMFSKNKQVKQTSPQARSGTLTTIGNETDYDIKDLATPSTDFPKPQATANYNSASAIGSDNNKTLFIEDISNNNERFTRLENAVQNFRNEFDEMRPSLNRLINIEKDIGELVTQLKTLTEAPASTQTVQQNAEQTPVENTAQNKPLDIKPQTIAPAKSGSLKDIRLSVSNSSMRVVFDASEKLQNTALFDSQENLVTIETNGAPVSPSMLQQIKKSSAVSDASVTAQDGKNIIAIQLKKQGRALIPFKFIPPSATNPNYRYYFDIQF
ncbi:MAG: hypothetical protein CMH30_00735 [Micavibrio sp.]|nr:hypothetical protein [Micavibrio sp.]